MPLAAGPGREGIDAWIGLGSSLGDRLAHLQAAARELAQVGEARFSSLYETTPVFPPGSPGSEETETPPFLNAVCRLRTEMAPLSLAAWLLSLEVASGRKRAAGFAARTIDLDLLAYSDLRLKFSASGQRPTAVLPFALDLPHPRMHLRRFVLVPLSEIDPDWHHPLLDIPVKHLLDRLGTEPGVNWHCGASALFL